MLRVASGKYALWALATGNLLLATKLLKTPRNPKDPKLSTKFTL